MAFEAGTMLGRLKLDHSGFATGILESEALAKVGGEHLAHFLANPLLGSLELIKSGIESFKESLTSAFDIGHEFENIHARTGIAVDSLAAMKIAADLSGKSLEDAAEAVQHMQRAMNEVISGKRQDDPFHALGIGLFDSAGQAKKAEPLFLEVARSIASLKEEYQRTGAATEIFSRSGGELLPLFESLKNGLDEYRGMARDIFGINSENVEGFARMRGAMKLFEDSIEGLKITFASALLKSMGVSATDLTGHMVGLKKKLDESADSLGRFLGGFLSARNIDSFTAAIEKTIDVVRSLIPYLKEAILAFAAIEGAKAGDKVGGLFGKFGEAAGAIGGGIGAVYGANKLISEIEAASGVPNAKALAGSADKSKGANEEPNVVVNNVIHIDGKESVKQQIKAHAAKVNIHSRHALGG